MDKTEAPQSIGNLIDSLNEPGQKPLSPVTPVAVLDKPITDKADGTEKKPDDTPKVAEGEEKGDHEVAESLKSPLVDKAISDAVEGTTGRKPRADIIREIAAGTIAAMHTRQFWGHALSEMATGMVVGGGAKTIARLALGMSGVGTVQLAVLGMTSGAANAGFKEYMRQRKEFTPNTDAGLKAEISRKLKLTSGTKMRNAIIRGSVCGLVGGVVGGEIAEAILNHISLPEINLSGLSSAVGSAKETLGNIMESHTPNIQVPDIPKPQVPSIDNSIPTMDNSNIPVSPTDIPPVEIPPVETVQSLPPTDVSEHVVSGSTTDTIPTMDGNVVNVPPAETPSVADVPAGNPTTPAEIIPTMDNTTVPSVADVPAETAQALPEYDSQILAWVNNGVNNIGHLSEVVGQPIGSIDNEIMAQKLQEAADLQAQGQLTQSAHEDLFNLFHLSNGTASVYNSLLTGNTVNSLVSLGVLTK